MKFCEKLQKLRKEKGYSQEQLADLLEVSRQSVSKWESGTTYPEMDKLLSLCKIFNVSLDDLTNDDVSSETIKEKSRNNFSNLIYTILDMINKTIEMFKNMGKKEIVKCIVELIVVILILLICKIPFYYINSLVRDILSNFPYSVFNIVNSIWLFLSNTIYLVLFIAIFIFVYKSRYLDKFNPDLVKQDKKEIEVKEEKEDIKHEKGKEKHSFIIFDILGNLFNIFIKVILFIIVLFIIACFVILVILTLLSLVLQFMGIHYIGVFIALLGITLIVYCIMEIIIRALFSNPIKFKRLFIMFITSLVISCLGVVLVIVEVANTKFIDELPSNIETSLYETNITMTDNLYIESYDYDYIEYVIDDNLEDTINIKVNYYEDYNNLSITNNTDYVFINTYTDYNKGMNFIKSIKSNLENKEVYNYDGLYRIHIIVTASNDNINKLQENYNKILEEQQEENNMYEYYEEQISSLEEELYLKDEQITELQEKVENLEEKISTIQDLTTD